VQNCRINLDFDLLLKGKSGGPSPRTVDRARGLVHGSTMDLTVAGGRSSPELGLVAPPGHDGLPRRHQRQEGSAGTLAVGSPLAERRRGGLAAVESRAWWRRSVCEVLEERRVGGRGVERWRQGCLI
jgi:hypothetical protein